MPVIRDPDFGATYTYSTRRDSLIHIWHPSLPPLQIPVELRIPRWLLTLSSSWTWLAQACSVALIQAAKAPPSTRKRILVIPLWSDVPARLRIDRTDLHRVRQFVNAPPPIGYSHEEALHATFSVFLLNSTVLARIACPARGPRAKHQRLYDLLPGALLACRALVAKAEDDKALQRRIRKVIEEDDVARAYVCWCARESDRGKKARAVALAERALRGVATNTNLLQVSSEEVLKDWFYPREKSAYAKRLLELVHRRAPDFYPWDTWTRLYLGQPGDAARAFGLIPA